MRRLNLDFLRARGFLNLEDIQSNGLISFWKLGHDGGQRYGSSLQEPAALHPHLESVNGKKKFGEGHWKYSEIPREILAIWVDSQGGANATEYKF